MNRAQQRLAGAVLVVGLLALGACGDDDVADEPAPGATPTVATLPGGAPAPTTPVTTATGGGPAGTTAATEPGTSPTAASGGGPDETAAPPSLDGHVPVGAFAPALLQPGMSERLVIELHADVAPDDGAIAHVVEQLAEVSGKPVSVTAGSAPSGGDRPWTAEELTAAADVGAAPQGNGVAVVRLLFVRGTFEGDDGVLGVAVRGDVAAIFPDRVASAGGLLGGTDAIETAVVTHEVGHLLGLVDLARDTGRADPEHPGHSRNQGSVMYWAVESDVIGQVLGANPPQEFDADDLADLSAIRNGG